MVELRTIVTCVGVEWEAQLSIARELESAFWSHAGPWGKGRDNAPGVPLLGLGNPPAKQVPLLVVCLHRYPCHVRIKIARAERC